MLRWFIVCFFCSVSLLSLAQQKDSSIYTIDKAGDYTAHFSLKWEYPKKLKELLPTASKNPLVDWRVHLLMLNQYQARYKTIVLPQKEVLASCALMLILLNQESDSEFYQKKALYIQLLQGRLNPVDNRYLTTCLEYLEQQYKSKEIISLWQTYFHYTTNSKQALFAAEKLLSTTEKASHLPLQEQEDLMATAYYILGDIYADRGSWSYKKRSYLNCYKLRKKRGDDLCYSLNRILKQTSPGLQERKLFYKDLLSSIQQYGCRKDKKLFNEALDYLLKYKEYDLALELFEQGTLQHPSLQNIEELSYGTRCPYLYLAVEALSTGSKFDAPSQDSIALIWFKKWLSVIDALESKDIPLSSKPIQLEEQYYSNYIDHTCTRIIDYLLYYGNSTLAKQFFEQYQKPIYAANKTNPSIIYNFNSFYYKFIPHHSIVVDNSLVLSNLKSYLDLSYELIKGEEKAQIEGLEHPQTRGRECIAWLGQRNTTTNNYLTYLEYWMLRAKQLNYLSEEILAYRYYCAALRKDQQYVKALEFALKFKQLSHSSDQASIIQYASKVQDHFLDNVLNHYEIDSKERKEAMLFIKKKGQKKDRKWARIALKKLKKQVPYKDEVLKPS